MSRTIPYENLKTLNKPFERQFKDQFGTFLESGWYILGQEVSHFETEFANYHTEQHVVGVANGLDALTLAIRCCNFREHSEIIVPSNTYIASILSILQAGMIPVFVEPEIDSYNIDPKKIESALTSKTAAIMVVHLYGRCCDMDPIMALANARGLKVIEDCAQAHGAKYKGKLAGTFGDFGAFSFYPTKNLGALGDAGAVLCKKETDAVLLRQLRNYGSEKKYYNGVIGYNSRLDELQASFLRLKLPHLDKINTHKKELAALYMEGLDNSFIKPATHPDYEHVYHIFNIRHQERDRIRTYLAAHQIGTEVHYPVAPHLQQALKDMNHLSYPLSEEIHHTTLSLPCSFAHSKEDILYTIDILNNFR